MRERRRHLADEVGRYGIADSPGPPDSATTASRGRADACAPGPNPHRGQPQLPGAAAGPIERNDHAPAVDPAAAGRNTRGGDWRAPPTTPRGRRHRLRPSKRRQSGRTVLVALAQTELLP